MKKSKIDFATKTTIPTTEEYEKASISQILDRLNRNPKGLESESSFIQALLLVKIAENSEKQTRNLVFGTWALVIVTIGFAIVQVVCK
ncbi:MAG: hypothetical protein KKD38_07455 [Candidatus Delongbacteria bacterium]|nr:hypothetical protein [Candidatus Delongbacteria bacterium]